MYQSNQRGINQNNKFEQKQIPIHSQILQRNEKLAQILIILVTFTQKIEKVKQKLCGFPGVCFSPQQLYKKIDKTNKGYININDIRKFITSSKVTSKHIQIMFNRINNNSSIDTNDKLAYFAYLKILKPYFRKQLAKDILMRDTLSYQTNIVHQQLHQSVLKLFEELIFLLCICTVEHEEAKKVIMQKYMLNSMEISQIIGLGGVQDNLSVFKQFITHNSQFEVSLVQMKYLLAFCDTHESLLHVEKNINIIFLPNNIMDKKNKNQINSTYNTKYNKLHHYYNKNYNNYYKTYLGPNSLIKQQKINLENDQSLFYQPQQNSKYHFLNSNYPKNQRKMSNSESQHFLYQLNQPKVIFSKPDKQIEQKQQYFEKVKNPILKNEYGMDVSVLKEDELNTPVLSKFMHDSIIPINMCHKSRKYSHEDSAFMVVHPNKPYQFIVNEQPQSSSRAIFPERLTKQYQYGQYNPKQSSFNRKSYNLLENNIEILKKINSPQISVKNNKELVKSKKRINFKQKDSNINPYGYNKFQSNNYYQSQNKMQSYMNQSQYSDQGVLAPFFLKPYQ